MAIRNRREADAEHPPGRPFHRPTPEGGRADRFGDPPPHRLAVMRALQLGDVLCAIPALRALRAALPEAHVTLVGLPWAEGLVDRFPGYLDAFVRFPGYPGLPEQPPRLEALPAFLAGMQGRRLDLAVQLHGSGGVTNPLVACFGARRLAGFFEPGRYCPDPAGFLPYPAAGSEVRRLLALVRFLGAPDRGEALEFPVRAADRAALAALPGTAGLAAAPYACLHAGARAAARRWPPDRFAAVGSALAARGLRVVLTGSAEEAPVTAAVAARTVPAPLDLAGRTTLGSLAALLAGARLVVSNDTGVAHLATAVGTPSVVLFAPEQVERWAPLDRRRHRVVTPLAEATPAAVLAEAEALLDAGPSSPPRRPHEEPAGAR